MIKEIIFDCFGVLTEDGWLAFMRRYGTESNSQALHALSHQVDRAEISYEQFLGRVTKLAEASEADAHRLITTSHHPNGPLFAYIEELQQRGYTLGIISNVGRELTEYLPEKYLSVFDHITLSYRVGATKPDPLIYETHLSQAGLSATEVVFIDDRETNCEAAAMLGMQAVVYQSTNQSRTELETLLKT